MAQPHSPPPDLEPRRSEEGERRPGGPGAGGDAAPSLSGPVDIRSMALTGIFVLLLGWTLVVAQSLLVPIVLALLAHLALSPVVRHLARRGLPQPLGAAVLLVALVAAGVYSLSFLAAPAQSWLERAPQSLAEIEQKLTVLKEPLEEISQASQRVDEVTTMDESDTTPTVRVEEPSWLEIVSSQGLAVLATAGVAIVLLYMLLASGDSLLRKALKLVPRLEEKKHVVGIVRETEEEISRYLLTIALINASLGVVVALVMAAWGLPNPVLWGAMTGLLNFIPYVGALVSVSVVFVVGLVSLDTAWQALLAALSLGACTSLEGMVVTPTLLGRRMRLSPVVVLVGLLFWSWMWGGIGALIAVPTLVIAKIVCARVASLRPVSVFLGD